LRSLLGRREPSATEDLASRDASTSDRQEENDMTEERCEKWDMPASMCAHCRGNTKTPVEEFEAENRRLRAKLLASDPR
jgi:hypothetical protein